MELVGLVDSNLKVFGVGYRVVAGWMPSVEVSHNDVVFNPRDVESCRLGCDLPMSLLKELILACRRKLLKEKCRTELPYGAQSFMVGMPPGL